jgi:hypothetical protein
MLATPRDFGLRTPDLRLRTSGFTLLTSDLPTVNALETSDARYEEFVSEKVIWLNGYLD